jgi:hypothetical protein
MKRLLFSLLIMEACFFSIDLWWNALHQEKTGSSVTSRLKVASDAVAEAATAPTLSTILISGPASVSTGICTPFRVTVLDQHGMPFKLAQTEPVGLLLFSAASASFSTSSSCSKARRTFITEIAGGTASQTFYAEDAVAESFLVQPVLITTPPIYGTEFTLNFVSVGDSPTTTPAATPSSSSTPIVIPTPSSGPSSISSPSSSPSPTPTPPALNLTYKGCWYTTGGNHYQALDFQLASPATLIIQGELYTGSGCLPDNWNDQLNDFGISESFGTFGYIFWFTHRANMTDVSVLWSFSDKSNDLLWSSSCVDYATAPPC